MADRNTPARALRPIFASMMAAGYRRLQLIVFRTVSATSRVLGDLKAMRGYAVGVTLSDASRGGSELALEQTYADLAKIADAAAAKGKALQLAIGR